MRLAFKDLEHQRKIEEQKLKGLDGKKKEQAERLGMGLGIRRYVDDNDDDDDDEETSHPVRGVHFQTFCFCCFLQWCVSLCDIRHAHHPAGESTGNQDHQRTTVSRGGG